MRHGMDAFPSDALIESGFTTSHLLGRHIHIVPDERYINDLEAYGKLRRSTCNEVWMKESRIINPIPDEEQQNKCSSLLHSQDHGYLCMCTYAVDLLQYLRVSKSVRVSSSNEW